MSDDLKERIFKVKLLILDIDGVLTDGRIIYGDYGDELKFFNVQDGFGLVMLHRVGISKIMSTTSLGRRLAAIQRRARDSSLPPTLRRCSRIQVSLLRSSSSAISLHAQGRMLQTMA